MANRLGADFRAIVNNREKTNSVQIEQQEKRTTEERNKEKAYGTCNNRSIITDTTEAVNNNRSPKEKEQTTNDNNNKNNRFSLTDINRRCRNFIFRSSERPTLYSQIQPNKDSVNEDDNNNNNKNDNEEDTNNNKKNNNNNDNNEEQKRETITEVCERYANDSKSNNLEMETETDMIPQQTIQSQTDASDNEDDETISIE